MEVMCFGVLLGVLEAIIVHFWPILGVSRPTEPKMALGTPFRGEIWPTVDVSTILFSFLAF